MTKHKFGPSSKSSKGQGHPIMYGRPKAAQWFDAFPDGGGYPKGFLEWAFDLMEVTDPTQVCHLCSGSMRVGITVDIRASMKPQIIADCRDVPLPDESLKWIIADPPYSTEYAKNLYDTENVYPKPYDIVKEAGRLLQPGGQMGLLHFQVPYFRRPMKLLGVYGITQGLGYNIRAFTHLQKAMS